MYVVFWLLAIRKYDDPGSHGNTSKNKNTQSFGDMDEDDDSGLVILSFSDDSMIALLDEKEGMIDEERMCGSR